MAVQAEKWIELIRVRSSEATLAEAMPTLETSVRDVESGLTQGETFFLKHALYDGDLAVVLVWTNGAPAEKSREGLLLAEQLGQLGSVDHAVWIPTHKEG